jgi:hypothetical protein
MARLSTLSRRQFLRAAAALSASDLSLFADPLNGGPSPLFEEIPSTVSGLTWKHENARSAARLLPESLGPGVAFLDYDNDGWMDIYLVNSGLSDFYLPVKPLRNALYKNNRDGTFTDVTEKAGVSAQTFGMGVACGDYNNDGYPDLFVTGYGAAILYRNNGDGTFTDVTAKAGLAAPGWTTSAVWFDYDNDGRLDLFVCRYVQYGPDQRLACAEKDGRGGLYYHYCIPHLFKPTSSLLFHNNGDGTFSRADGGTALEHALGKALGVVATDVNNDGLIDLVVSNDTSPNFLFLNRGQNRWEEQGQKAGIAFGATGNARSGMGIDAADLDGDGWQELIVANIDHEMYSLYRNNKDGLFTDEAGRHGLAAASRLLSGWGLKFFDADNDGLVDLLIANGHPDDTIARRAPEVSYKQPLLLFRHDGRRLQNITPRAGPAFLKGRSARGLAIGDFNNDGHVDVLIGCNGEEPVLLRNAAGAANHWIGVKLQGMKCNRDAIGARIKWSAGGIERSRLKNGGGSYLSSHDPREVLGLGSASRLDWLEIKWPLPSGRVERFENLPIDRYVTLREGAGKAGGTGETGGAGGAGRLGRAGR